MVPGTGRSSQMQTLKRRIFTKTVHAPTLSNPKPLSLRLSLQPTISS